MRYAHLSPGHLHDAVNSLGFGKSRGKEMENFWKTLPPTPPVKKLSP
jgi:hypothetical protein